MKKINILGILITIFSIFMLCSCAHYGGGTIGTGLPLSSTVSKNANTGVLYISFTGSVFHQNGTPAKNANVEIITPKIEDQVLTDESGYFDLEIITTVNDNFEIKIKDKGKVYSTTLKPSKNNPNGGSGTFILEPGGSIRMSEINFY